MSDPQEIRSASWFGLWYDLWNCTGLRETLLAVLGCFHGETIGDVALSDSEFDLCGYASECFEELESVLR